MAQFMISLFVMTATVGAAIAALMSANAARKNLQEQGESNKRAIMPFLVIENKSFQLEFKPHEVFFKLNWDTGNFDLKDGYLDIGSYLEIINISKGTAKDVKVKITIENVHNFIELLSREMKYPIHLTTKKHPAKRDSTALCLSGSITSDVNEFTFWDTMFNITNLPQQDIIFVGADGGKNQIRIPDSYMVLYNLYINSNLLNSKVSMPYLKVNIIYEDIIGSIYEQNLQIKPKNYNVKTGIVKNTKARIQLVVNKI